MVNEKLPLTQNVIQLKELNDAIYDGLISGIAENFDPQKHLRSLKSQAKSK